ncbi:MAG: OmpA family protein, partial [Bacteroidota bacterium]
YVDGHTSSSGSSEENQAISLEKAQQIAAYVIKNYDIDPKRIVPRGMGETMLAVPERTRADRQRNERVEFNFLP